jgi:hypothetical protein
VGDNREKWGDFWEKSIVIKGALDNYSPVFVIFINFFGKLKD